MEPEFTFSAVILAGGRSRRMGQDKRFLLLDGRPLIEHVLDRLRPLVGEVLVATLEPERFRNWDVRPVVDRYPGMGALAGLHAGLREARGEWAFVVAADLPWLNPALLRAMADLARTCPADVIVPCWQGELEPLHALYRPATCAPAAEAALRRGQQRIIAFYPDVQVHILPESEIVLWDPQGRSFFNINTPEDWDRLKNNS